MPSILDLEASHVSIEALPGAVMIKLRRCVPGQSERQMISELGIAEAVQHWQLLGRAIQKAGALVDQRPGADAVVNL